MKVWLNSLMFSKPPTATHISDETQETDAKEVFKPSGALGLVTNVAERINALAGRELTRAKKEITTRSNRFIEAPYFLKCTVQI